MRRRVADEKEMSGPRIHMPEEMVLRLDLYARSTYSDEMLASKVFQTFACLERNAIRLPSEIVGPREQSICACL